MQPEPGLPKANQKLVDSLFAARGDDLLRYLISRLSNAEEAYLRLLRCNRDELVRHPEAYLFRIAASRSQYSPYYQHLGTSGGAKSVRLMGCGIRELEAAAIVAQH